MQVYAAVWIAMGGHARVGRLDLVCASSYTHHLYLCHALGPAGQTAAAVFFRDPHNQL